MTSEDRGRGPAAERASIVRSLWTGCRALVGLLALTPAAAGAQQDDHESRRLQMVRSQIEDRGVQDPATLEAMRAVPRHEFVDPALESEAYEDRPLPIGEGQTISQPYVVAFMTEHLEMRPGDKVLEVGTGSGYQAAVLAENGARVFTIEIFPSLAEEAEERLSRLGYDAVTVRQGDGYQGWPGEAPFDGIMVTAAPDEVPPPLLDQLRPGGRMVIPVGGVDEIQELLVIRKAEDGAIERESVMPVRFVPFLREEAR